MAPLIDMDRLTALVHETGVEYITNSRIIKNTWQEIAERYCREKGVELLPYKSFSSRWKNAKFQAKKKAERPRKYLKQTEKFEMSDLSE